MGKSKHLSEDEIKYIVSAETSKAQQEIHALTKATSTLKKEERERRKAMIELEAQGKKESEEYQNLSKECKEYTRQISANNKKIDEMRKKLDVNAMSMVQLKKQAKDLRTQLDNMSQALNPEEYANLERQLQKVNERMSDLKGNAKGMAELAKGEGTISVMMGNLFTKMAEWAGNTLAKMKDIALEGVEMAESADGVTKAFRAIDDGTMLDKLRKSTKDTVTDLDLMKAAVQAKDFRIPLEDLGKYLQFAQLKAQQTGQSVDYMTQSIVTGLGRKSVMILDNLGLSAAEINEEMAKTGDFMSAVASIVDKQLAAAGDNYVSAADRAMQKSVEFKNAQRELGETLLPLKEKWDDVYGGMEIGTMELIGWIVKHRAALVTLATAVTTYIAVQKIATAWNAKHASSTMLSITAEKLQAVQLALSRKAFLAKLIVMDLYKGRCNLATAAAEMFNIVLKASPLGLVTTLITTAAAALYLFGNKTSVADKSVGEFNKRLAVERASLNNIFEELKKTNPGTTERSRLVKELNDRYPDLIGNYNLESAKLKEITRAQNDANQALINRIATEMKAKTMADYVEKNVTTQMEKIEYLMLEAQSQMGQQTFAKLKPGLEAFFNESSKSMVDFWNTFGKYFHSTLSNDNMTAFRDAFISLRDDQKSLSAGVDDINKKYEPYIQSIKTVTALSDEEIKKQMEANSLIKKYEKERQTVQDTWSEANKDDIEKKNRELERLDNLIKKYRELGTVKATSEAENKAKKKTDDETKAVLEKEKNMLGELEQLRISDLNKEKNSNQSSLNAYKLLLQNKKISQEQYNILEVTAASNLADEVLRIETEYQDKTENLTIANLELKEKAVKDAAKRVQQSEQDSFNKRLQAEQTYQTNIEGIRGFIGEELSPEEKLKSQLNIQLSLLDSYYQASLEYARQNGEDETEITNLYNKARSNLQKKYYDEKNKLAENSAKLLYGMSGNELAGDVESLVNAIGSIRTALESVNEPDFWKDFGDNILQNMKTAISATTKMLSSAFNTFKDVELNNIDEKYNAEIEAAEGNSDEIERLEKEKAQKKLNIEKKYADVQFAIKVSEIIASTGLSIMQAFAQLGPIGGAIAAAMLAATSVIQITAANAERQKVKNMTLSGSSSSSKGSGQRVATGREDGGKIDVRRAQDGKLFAGADYDPDARGFIDKPTVIVGEGPAGQSKEWVASNAAVENPTVGPILDMIDKSQQAGTIRTLDLNQVIRSKMAGFSSGGSISQPLPVTGTPKNDGSGAALPPELMEKFAHAIIGINENGVKSSVVLTDLERKQELRDRSRQIGSK